MKNKYIVINKITGKELSPPNLSRSDAILFAAKWADENGYNVLKVNDSNSNQPNVSVSIKNYRKEA